MKEIVIATKNRGKAKEFKDFFSVYGIQAISLLDLEQSTPDVEETSTTFEGNATLKANQISKFLNKPVLADDSGLIVDSLGGKPGIYSARYAGEPKNDQANIVKVLSELKNIPNKQRTARFVCVLAIAQPGKDTFCKTGYCEGTISDSEKGIHGFGYDPIFIPENYKVSMAELYSKEKNMISHRSQAIKQLENWVKTI